MRLKKLKLHKPYFKKIWQLQLFSKKGMPRAIQSDRSDRRFRRTSEEEGGAKILARELKAWLLKNNLNSKREKNGLIVLSVSYTTTNLTNNHSN